MVEIELHGPEQLRRIVAKLRAAIEASTLEIASRPPDRLLLDLPDFLELDLGVSIPDVLFYVFACASCGQRFELDCDAYHGSGGRWTPT